MARPARDSVNMTGQQVKFDVLGDRTRRLVMVAAALGCVPFEAALASAHGTAATLATAGLRLLSLDPFDVTAVLHDLRTDVDAVADSTIGIRDADDLPHASTPFAEIDVERQPTLPTRLFRS